MRNHGKGGPKERGKKKVSKKTRRMMGRQMKADGMIGRKDQIDFNLDRRYGNPSKRFRKIQQRKLLIRDVLKKHLRKEPLL